MEKEIKHFDQTSDEYKKEYGRETTYGYSFRVRREKVLSLIQKSSDKKKVLDVGCGPGVIVENILNKGYKITCIDPAPQMINIVNKDYESNPDVNAVIGNIYELDFPDNSFDVVVAMGLLEYLENQDRAMGELYRVLIPGGILIITFPNKRSPWRAWNRLVLGLFRPIIKGIKRTLGQKPYNLKHREYTPKAVEALLENKGFKLEEILYFNFKIIPYPFDKIFPKLTIWQSRLFEKLDKTFLKFIGTGFIVLAKK